MPALPHAPYCPTSWVGMCIYRMGSMGQGHQDAQPVALTQDPHALLDWGLAGDGGHRGEDAERGSSWEASGWRPNPKMLMAGHHSSWGTGWGGDVGWSCVRVTGSPLFGEEWPECGPQGVCRVWKPCVRPPRPCGVCQVSDVGRGLRLHGLAQPWDYAWHTGVVTGQCG